MATVTVHQTGRADAVTVWQRYLHPQLWPTWSPQITSVDCADDSIRAGSTGVVHAVLGVRVSFEVTEVDTVALCWSWIARLPLGIILRLTHTVDAVAFGTTTGLAVTGPAPVVLGYLPVAAVALRKLVRSGPLDRAWTSAQMRSGGAARLGESAEVDGRPRLHSFAGRRKLPGDRSA